MSKIQVLSEHLTNMIAAGEVVERPAGIVKECVENSIDAGAKVIDIEAFQGGIEKLIITDDGSGMDYEDAQMAFMRHATSKLQQEEDLFNIHTMGFRGEALPSIASVAKVELQTNDGNQGTLIRYHYGELVTKEKCSCPLGTRIEISSLFLKTPARFKHLKSISYEFSIIADLVNKMALSHPEIRFTLSHDGRIVFQTSGNGNLQEILYQMYGKEVASNAIPFEQKSDDFQISGYAVQPKINRATKYFMFITMNTRLIRSIPIQKAILDAYSHYMPSNRFPIVILDIKTDAQLVDVNVHPNKWEIRLSKQSELLELIKKTLMEAISSSLRTVKVQPKPTPVFEQQQISFPYPVRKEEKQVIEQPKIQPKIKEDPITKAFDTYQKPIENKVQEQEEVYVAPIEKEEKETTVGYDFFCHLRVIGQLKESYILCENEEGLVIIDQHAAQERYHYEQLVEKLSQPTTQTQPLMVPIQLHVSSNLVAQVEKINEQVSFFGLSFDVFGTDQLLVREIPLWFQNVHQEDFFYDLLDYFAQNQEVDMEMLRKHVIATMACHSSIRFHRALNQSEMEQVILDLQKCKQPYHCPHGRPTVITMSDKDLRKEFERG